MNIYLILAGVLSTTAATLHVGCIMFGAPWYRFFGAGEQMVLLSERGSIKPTIITSTITLTLATWASYAFSAAGLIGRFPFTRTTLVMITSIYFGRGIVGVFFINNPIERSPQFWLWSSVMCLFIGAIHLIGLQQQWTSL